MPVCSGLERVPILKVATGLAHIAAIGKNGGVYTWGKSDRGQLGHGNNLSDTLAPKQVDALFNEKVIDVSCGVSHTVVSLTF